MSSIATKSTPTSGKHRLEALDGLRFAAALWVAFYHLTFAAPSFGLVDHTFPEWITAWSRFGYLGVDIFFVLSGYLVFKSSWNRTPRQFLASRASRLYPAYWACVIVTATTALLTQYDRTGTASSESEQLTATQVLINLTMLQEFVDVPHVDGAYWSLTCELCFYGLIFLFMIRGGFSLIRARVLMFAWLAVSLSSQLGLLDHLPFEVVVNKLLLPRYSHYFIAGMALYLIFERGARIPEYAILLACAPLTVLAAAQKAEYVSQVTGTEFGPFVPVAVGFIGIGIVSLVAAGRVAVHHRLLPVAGRMSYPMYLLHGKIGFALMVAVTTDVDGVLFVALYLPVVMAASYLVVRIIEHPLEPRLRRWLNGVSPAEGR